MNGMALFALHVKATARSGVFSSRSSLRTLLINRGTIKRPKIGLAVVLMIEWYGK